MPLSTFPVLRNFTAQDMAVVGTCPPASDCVDLVKIDPTEIIETPTSEPQRLRLGGPRTDDDVWFDLDAVVLVRVLPDGGWSDHGITIVSNDGQVIVFDIGSGIYAPGQVLEVTATDACAGTEPTVRVTDGSGFPPDPNSCDPIAGTWEQDTFASTEPLPAGAVRWAAGSTVVQISAVDLEGNTNPLFLGTTWDSGLARSDVLVLQDGDGTDLYLRMGSTTTKAALPAGSAPGVELSFDAADLIVNGEPPFRSITMRYCPGIV